MEWNGI